MTPERKCRLEPPTSPLCLRSPDLPEETDGGFTASHGDRMGSSGRVVPFDGGLDRSSRGFQSPGRPQQSRLMQQDMSLVEGMPVLMVPGDCQCRAGIPLILPA